LFRRKDRHHPHEAQRRRDKQRGQHQIANGQRRVAGNRFARLLNQPPAEQMPHDPKRQLGRHAHQRHGQEHGIAGNVKEGPFRRQPQSCQPDEKERRGDSPMDCQPPQERPVVPGKPGRQGIALGQYAAQSTKAKDNADARRPWAEKNEHRRHGKIA
jgi:hypothetical protein